MKEKLLSGYMHYLGADELTEFVAPSEEAVWARVATAPASRDSGLAVSILPVSVIS
ncbi:hypothetical protein [Actinacidiphila sp. bgisy167]|uniref:hypothetical protein n=1 Tax=Actinacidiphila sp. bgisy167 TaxID=3413797 RepID=UPI003D72CE92